MRRDATSSVYTVLVTVYILSYNTVLYRVSVLHVRNPYIYEYISVYFTVRRRSHGKRQIYADLYALQLVLTTVIR